MELKPVEIEGYAWADQKGKVHPMVSFKGWSGWAKKNLGANFVQQLVQYCSDEGRRERLLAACDAGRDCEEDVKREAEAAVEKKRRVDALAMVTEMVKNDPEMKKALRETITQ